MFCVTPVIGARSFSMVDTMEITFGELMMGCILIKFIIAALWYEYA